MQIFNDSMTPDNNATKQINNAK